MKNSRRNRSDASGAPLHLTQFPVFLEIQPELGTRAKSLGEHDGHVSADAALAPADFIDGLAENADVSGERGLSNPTLIKLVCQHLSGMDGDRVHNGPINGSPH